MEDWRKTSSLEPFPLGGRNDKRKMEVGNSSRNKKAPRALPVVHAAKEFLGGPINGGANNFRSEAAPCIQVENKIFSKELRKMIWSLQQGMTAEEARTKLPLGAGTSKYLAPPPQRLAPLAKLLQESHPESRILGNRDHKSEVGSKNPHRSENEQHREVKARNRVMDILHKFREYCDKLSDMKRNNWNEKERILKRVDLLAAQMVKKEFGYNTEKQYLGPVPGVKIGDKFSYRMELHVLGLHRPPQSGIDTMYYGGEKIATSVVASGGYSNYMRDPDTLIYCGHGGNASGSQEQVEDQKLEAGNRALLNSKRAKNPVRVIKGRKELRASDQCSIIYTFDGLYTVEDMWVVKDSVHHKIVFNFKLVKIPGQS